MLACIPLTVLPCTSHRSSCIKPPVISSQVPLIVRAPHLPASRGQSIDTIVELVDMYRTIAELSSLPESAVSADVGGRSFALLMDPTVQSAGEAFDNAAYSQFPRCSDSNHEELPCALFFPDGKPGIVFMGLSIRTPTMRYTAWYEWDKDVNKPICAPYPSEVGQYELYRWPVVGTENK